MSAKMDMIEIETKKLELETGKFELDQRQAKALSVSAFFPDNLKNDVASAVIGEWDKLSVKEIESNPIICHSNATPFEHILGKQRNKRRWG